MIMRYDFQFNSGHPNIKYRGYGCVYAIFSQKNHLINVQVTNINYQ